MPRLQSLGTKFKQLNAHGLSSPFTSTHLSDEHTRCENEPTRLLSIKPPQAHDMTHPRPSSPRPATPTALPVINPTTGTISAPAQSLDWPFPAPKLPPAPPAPPHPDPLTHHPSSIPKTTHSTWLAHMPCPVAFSPGSPRATWPWPSWVCDAFEAGDVLWCTIGRGAKAEVNIRARRWDLVEYFEGVEANGGVVDRGGGEGRRGKDEVGGEVLGAGRVQDGKVGERVFAGGMIRGGKMVQTDKRIERMGDGKQGQEKDEELRQLLAATQLHTERLCAKAKVQKDNEIAQRDDRVTKLEKGILQQLEAIKLEAEKLRVRMQGQWNETGKEGDEDWEVLDGVFDEEGWIDVSMERKIGFGWAMVRQTVPSVGEDGGDGA